MTKQVQIQVQVQTQPKDGKWRYVSDGESEEEKQ